MHDLELVTAAGRITPLPKKQRLVTHKKQTLVPHKATMSSTKRKTPDAPIKAGDPVRRTPRAEKTDAAQKYG